MINSEELIGTAEYLSL